MLESKSRAWVEIDLSKIKHNVEEIRKILPSTTKIMAIVKANAYGHGDVVCCKELEKCGIDFFGVSSIDEALTLRENGIQEEILILGYTPPEHFHYVIEKNLIQTFLSLDYAKKADKYCEEHHVIMRGHIKVDTGMSRLGIICQEQEYHIEQIEEIYRMKHIKAEGIFSHFSVSDELDADNKKFTSKQIELFERVLSDLKKDGIDAGIRHLQNSYGILNYPELQYDYVRPGLLYLGATSNDQIETVTHPDFKPIMELKANISLVKTIQPNVSVSYGRHFISKDIRKIATVSIGYADGYPRSLSNKGYVLIRGKKAPILGRVCMDQFMVDVTQIEGVSFGDKVTMIGKDGNEILPVEVLSELSGRFNYEFVCDLGKRIPRVYVRDGKIAEQVDYFA